MQVQCQQFSNIEQICPGLIQFISIDNAHDMEALLANMEKFPLPFFDPLCASDSPDWVLPQLHVSSPRGSILMLFTSRPTRQSTQTITTIHASSAVLTLLAGCIVAPTRDKAGAGEMGSLWLTALVQGRGAESFPPAGHQDCAAGRTRLTASRGAALKTGHPVLSGLMVILGRGLLTSSSVFTQTCVKAWQAVPHSYTVPSKQMAVSPITLGA